MKKIVVFGLMSLNLFAYDNRAEIPLLNRLSSRNMRYGTFHKAMQLMQDLNAKVLVETGCARFQGAEAFYGDGASTVIFGHWAQMHGAHLYSVDISAKNVANAKQLAQEYSSSITVTESDSIAYLSSFDKQIDFLYLDSFDFEQDNPEPSQQHHLKEIQVAYDKLAPHAIVMIDDCGLPHGGKGKYVIQFLVARGWKMVANGYQVIFIR